MKLEQTPVAMLIPYANNARTHDENQVKQIASSIKEFGFNNPVLIDEDNSIIAGHGRTLAAELLGLFEVPTITLPHLTKAQKKAYILADNRMALNAGWDIDLLKLEILDLDDEDFDLTLTGFDDDELAEFLKEDLEPQSDEDEVPEIPEEPISKEGDIWILGNHRVMCGDSTSIDAVEKLMDGATIDLVHTDPPYGINESGKREGRGNLGKEGSKILAKGTNYVDFDDSTTDAAIDAFNLCEGLGISRQVWWGANYYSHAIPQTNNWLVWDKRTEDKYTNTNGDAELAYVKSKWSSIRIFRHLWMGLVKGSEHGEARVHPTQKPIALAVWVYDYYKDVNTVMDLFGGSGFNIIASEKTGKQCFTMEFTPHYVDVIVKRWQDYTGKEAILESTNESFNSLLPKEDAA